MRKPSCQPRNRPNNIVILKKAPPKIAEESFDCPATDMKFEFPQPLFAIGLAQSSATDQLVCNISDNLIQITAHPLIDLIAQVLRHKALKALADIFDPFGKEIVYLFIRHIKERNELLKLLVRKTRDFSLFSQRGNQASGVFRCYDKHHSQNIFLSNNNISSAIR